MISYDSPDWSTYIHHVTTSYIIGTFQNINRRIAHDILCSHIKIIVPIETMDGMENFNISAEEEQMLQGLDENTNSTPMEASINTTADPRNYSLSGNLVIESEYH